MKGSDNAVINEKLTAQVANLIEVLLTSDYVKVNHDAIIDYVLTMAQLTELVDSTSIYLPHDADELAATVEALLNTVISVPGYNNINTIIENSVEEHISALLTKEVILGALDAIELSTSTTVLGTAYRVGAKLLVDMLGEPFTSIIDTNVTNAVAALDYATLFDVVRVAIAAGAVEVVRNIVVNGHDAMVVVDAIEVEQYEDVVYAALNALPQLQLVNGLLDDIAEAYLSQYKLSDEQLDSVDFVAEINTINTIISEVIALARANEIETVADYKALVTADYKEYITDSNVQTVITIAREALKLQSVNIVALDVYNSLVYNGLENSNIKPLLDLTSVYGTSAALIAELDSVLEASLALPKVGAVSIVKDAIYGTSEVQITAEVIEVISNFAEKVLGTQYVAVNNNNLVAMALTYVPSVPFTAEELAIDLSADKEEITTLFEVVANILVADPNYQYGSQLASIANAEGAKEVAKMFLETDNALEVIDTLDAIAEATVMVAAAKVAVVMAEGALATYAPLADLIDRSRMDTILYVEDVRTVLGILEVIVLAEPKEDIMAVYGNSAAIKDINIMKYTDVIAYVLETIPTINVIKGGIADTIINLVDAVNARGLDIQLSAKSVNAIKFADYVVEFTAYATILTDLINELAPVVGSNSELTFNDLMACAKAIRENSYNYETFNAVVNPIVDAIDAFVECELVAAIAIDLFNGALSVLGNETLINLLTLNSAYTAANFAHDAQVATDIVRVLAESNLYQAIYAQSIKGLDARGNGVASVQELITLVSSLDFLSLNDNAKFVEIVKFVGAYVGVQGLVDIADRFSEINLVSEGQIASSMVPELVEIYKALNANDLRPDLYMIGDTELMAHVISVYETAITTETAEILLPVIANDYALPYLYNLTVQLGRPVEQFNRTYADETIMKVANKGAAALDALMELGVFSNNGITLANEAGTATNEEIVRIYDLVIEYAPVPARVKPWLANLVDNVYILGNIPLDYSNMRFADEKESVVEFISLAQELINKVTSLASASDINGIINLEDEVVELYNKALESEIMSQLAIPAMNMAYIALAEQYVFVLFDEADGITNATFADEVIAPVFEAARLVTTAVTLKSAGTLFMDVANFDNIKVAIDTIVNAAFVNGGATQNLEQLMRRATLLVTKQHLSADVVATEEVEVLKDLVDCAADLLDAGIYEGGLQMGNILSDAGLLALADAFRAIEKSTAAYELKDWAISKLEGKLPKALVDMVKDASQEELKADTLALADVLDLVVLSQVFNDGNIQLVAGGPTYLSQAIDKAFSINMVAGHEERIFDLMLSKLGLTGSTEDVVSWEEEVDALCALIASLDGIIASGVQLTENGSVKFENLIECEDEAALTATLVAFNHVRSLRSMILTVVDENLGSMGSGSFDVNDFLSQSFKDQLESKEMADIAYWDVEMANLAKIVIKAKSLNTDVSSMTAADVDALTDVLHIMNNSELFEVNPITSILEDQLEDYNVTLEDTSSWSEAEWETEIDNIGDLLKEIIAVGSVDSDTITNMEKADLVALLTAMNHSRLTRVALPKVIDESVKSALNGNTTVAYADLVDTWLTNQVNGTMENVATWDAEIEILADIIMAIKDDEIFDVENATSYDAIEALLFDIRDSKSFKLEFLTKLMSSSLEPLVGTATLGTMGDDSDVRWGNETEGEIVDIINVLEAAKAIGAFAGTFDITTKSESQISGLLTAMNHSIVLRNTLPVVLYDAINDNEPSLVSAWLANEYNAVKDNNPATNMSSELVWDAEIAELAKVVATVASVDVIAMSTGELSSLLHTINKSKSLEIEGIYDLLSTVQSQMGIATLGTVQYALGDETAKFNAWEAEIDSLVKVVELAKAEGIVGGTTSTVDAILENSESENAALLKALNASAILRVALPKAIKDASASFHTDEFLTEWISGQTETSMKGIAEWNTEIEKLAKVIDLVNNSSINFSNISFGSSFNYTQLENILKSMNATSSFTVDGIVSNINEQLDDNGFDTRVSAVYDRNASGSNKDEWNTEIERLVDIIEVLADTPDFSVSNPELGGLLDTMKVSYIFGNDTKANDVTFNANDTDNSFNGLVLEILTDAGLLTTSANGFIDATDAQSDNWAAYNWSSELAIIEQFDTNASSQAHDFLKVAQGSKIIVKYFDIAGTLNDELASFTYEIPVYGSLSVTVKLADYINGGHPLTNEGLAERNWAEEVEAIEDIQNVFTNTTTLTAFANAVEAKANLYQAGQPNLLAVEACYSMRADIIAKVDALGINGAIFWATLIA